MKLHLPRRRIWRAAIYLGALVLIVIAIDMMVVQARRSIRHGYETTRIAAPLQADGMIDYVTAIEDYFGRGVTRENNAAPLILQALGRKALPKNQPEDGVTDRLGMPHLPEQGEYFVEYESYCKLHSATPENELLDLAATLSLPPKMSDATTGWINDNAKPLALIAEAAAKRPRFFIPLHGGRRLETLIETQLPYLHPILEVGKALRMRAATRLGNGDIAGFTADVATMHQLARLVAQQATLVDRLVGLRIEHGAGEALRAAASSGKLSAEQAKSLATATAALPNFLPFIECMDITERYMALDLMQTFARVGPVRAGVLRRAITSGTAAQPSAFHVLYLLEPLPYEKSMRAINSRDDGLVAAMRQPTYPQRRSALKNFENDLQNSLGPKLLWTFSADWALAAFLPSMIRATEHETAIVVRREITQLALQLAAHKAEHKTYPQSLAELASEKSPLDVFSEKPLIYLRINEGYKLYSVGPNMVDDAGAGDDLVVSVP